MQSLNWYESQDVQWVFSFYACSKNHERVVSLSQNKLKLQGQLVVMCIMAEVSNHWTKTYSELNPITKARIRVKSVFLMLESYKCIFFRGATAPSGLGSPHYRGFTNTRHTTFGSTPVDEWPPWRRDLYLTTHGTHKKQISLPSAGFEAAVPASEGPETRASDRAATGTGTIETHIRS